MAIVMRVPASAGWSLNVGGAPQLNGIPILPTAQLAGASGGPLTQGYIMNQYLNNANGINPIYDQAFGNVQFTK